MHVAEAASATHPGRVRPNNEDALLTDPPLFVLADGMGGAQAGEVASRLAIDAFLDLTGQADGPEDRLRRTIEEANRRIVEHATADPSAAGMGSTVTAALVDDEGRVAFGHVGDSRAYLLRDHALQQLSHDHSLVAELQRQGRLTAEEAEAHPQRSVITRALGAGPTVEVDTWSVESRPGDVFLLCSDGLSDFVPEAELARALALPGPLENALRALVRAANAAGGHDNISAIAFRVGEAGEPLTVGTLDEDTLTEDDGVPVVPPPPGQTTRQFTLVEPPPRRRRPWRAVLAVVVVVALAGGAVVGAVEGLRWAHFIGVDPDTGAVGVYQGVPLDVGFGRRLYRLTFRSRVDAAEITATRRRTLLDHKLRSRQDAMKIVRALEAAQP